MSASRDLETAVPPAVAAVAGERAVRAVWENRLGGLTRPTGWSYATAIAVRRIPC